MKGPLAGLRILDLSQVIAGPYAPVLLSQAGAEVIKVEPLRGELGRSLSGLFTSMNRGKRGICINLQTTEGREIFNRLAVDSDVLVENFRPGVVERLGIDYSTLKALNERLIYVSASAFGSAGPYAHRPGFDPLLQAMAGTERAQGGRHNPPVFLRIPITDYVSGLMTAAAITNALFHRERTGLGEHLQLSLLRNGIFINGDAFTRYDGHPERPLPDAGQHGLSALDRMYETSDGWLFLLAETEDAWCRLVALPELRPLADDARFAGAEERRRHDEELAAALDAVFRQGSTDSWLERLESAGVPCAPVVVGYNERFFEDVQPIVNRYVRWCDDAEAGHVEYVGNLIHYGESPPDQQGITWPRLGEHTQAIMMELGYTAEEIGRLLEAKVIA